MVPLIKAVFDKKSLSFVFLYFSGLKSNQVHYRHVQNKTTKISHTRHETDQIQKNWHQDAIKINQFLQNTIWR